MQLIRVGLAIVIAIISSGRLEERCSCMGTPAACESIWGTDAAFVATVLSVGDLLRGPVRLKVTEAFKGATVGEIELPGGRGSSCSFSFNPGVTYLVFAHRGDNGALGVSTCSRTRPIGEAGDDLTYLRTVYRSEPRLGVVRGVALGTSYDSKTQRPVADHQGSPFEGLTVTLSGYSQRWMTTSGADGRYEFRVPPGDYELAVHPPSGFFSVTYSESEVSLPDPRACAVRDFTINPESRLRGRVVDAKGAPVPFLAVELVTEFEPVREDVAPNAYALTDSSGRFEFQQLLPGWHRIGIGLSGVTKDPVFPVWLTTDRGAFVDAQQTRDLGSLVMSGLSTVVVTVEARDATGHPLEDAIVMADDIESGHTNGGTADKDGMVRLSLALGRQYSLSAYWRSAPVTGFHLSAYLESVEIKTPMPVVRLTLK